MAYQPEEITEYNPADLANLVRYCVQELMQRKAHLLSNIDRFAGAGIYALFYDGDFPLYQFPSIRSSDFTHPVYVGRARITRSSGPNPLFSRLRDHRSSIVAAQNLRIEDFRCRFLVLHPLWVSTVEDLLIEHYKTLWNDSVKGFGIHDPGGKRHGGELPLWDTLHPGRAHASKMVEKGAQVRPIDEIVEAIESFVAQRTELIEVPSSIEADKLMRSALREEQTGYDFNGNVA